MISGVDRGVSGIGIRLKGLRSQLNRSRLQGKYGAILLVLRIEGLRREQLQMAGLRLVSCGITVELRTSLIMSPSIRERVLPRMVPILNRGTIQAICGPCAPTTVRVAPFGSLIALIGPSVHS